MKKNLLLAAACLLMASCGTNNKPAGQEPLRIIFETDMGNDIDDGMALDMLNKYMDDGTVNLLAVTLNKEGTPSVQYVDIMNTWYGHPGIPIGTVSDGVKDDSPVSFASKVCDLKDADGNELYPHTLTDYTHVPDAVTLYRQLLSKQPDHSVVIVSVGFSTNLARLLDTPADQYSRLDGKQLVSKKVKQLVTMAADFADLNHSEFNVVRDIPAAQKVFSEWPTEVVTSPFEVGLAIQYPATSIENDFGWAEHHPYVDGYVNYQPMPYDRPTWDATAVLYAVEGTAGYFTLSEPGIISIDDKGRSTFTPDAKANRRYLKVDEAQQKSTLSRLIQLIARQPKARL